MLPPVLEAASGIGQRQGNSAEQKTKRMIQDTTIEVFTMRLGTHFTYILFYSPTHAHGLETPNYVINDWQMLR